MSLLEIFLDILRHFFSPFPKIFPLNSFDWILLFDLFNRVDFQRIILANAQSCGFLRIFSRASEYISVDIAVL